MSIIADYRVLTDGNIAPSLGTDGDFHDFQLSLPANLQQGSTHLPVLSFRLDTGTPTGLVFRIRTKNPASAFVTAFTGTYNSDVAHSVHEMVNINTLLAGVTNTIRFERVSGSGTLGVSDVVLWYKRNVTAANLLITP